MREQPASQERSEGRGQLGRPSKFTAERKDRILDAIRAGNYVETAALAAGVGKSTFYEWLERYPDFRDAVESARADAEVRKVAVIDDAADTSWQAAAWWLERSFPRRWGRRDRRGRDASTEVEHAATNPVHKVYRTPTPERALELLRLIADEASDSERLRNEEQNGGSSR